MQINAAELKTSEVRTLLQGDTRSISLWTEQWDWKRAALHVAIIVAGAGLYGAAMGAWRAPEQALFTAIKFPFIILLVTLGNALINGMLAPLLGLNIPFRQSLAAVLMSFTITAIILAAFSPLAAFVVWNSPAMVSHSSSWQPTYGSITLLHVAMIAFAGTTGNFQLYQVLVKLGGGPAVARRVLFAWLWGNMFLGTQLTWILRPFIGSPDMPVQFLRADVLHGNFYENVFHTLVRLIK